MLASRSIDTGLVKRLIECLSRVPLGRVVCHDVLSRELGIDKRHVVGLLHALNAEERDAAPWHRAVADGGAIGRHAFRDEQMRRLREEGVPVAPVGIVRELAERRIACFSDIGPPSVQTAVAPAVSRARGSRGRPRSTVG